AVAVPPIEPHVRPSREFRDIAPYKNDLLKELALSWHPAKRNDHVVVLLEIAKSGDVVNAQNLTSGGRKQDKQVLAAIEQAQFDPLPDWFKGESLEFNITMDAE